MKLYKFGLWLLPVVVLVSCSDTDYTTDYEKSDLTIVASNVEFGPVAATGGIKVSCSRPLTVTGGADWCKVSANGDSITVSVAEYNGDVSRNATVNITDGLRKLRVPVHQTAGSLEVGNKSFVTGFRKSEFDLSVLSNMDYKVEVEPSAASWLTLTPAADGYTVGVAAYDGGAIRQGHIYFSSSVKKDTVTVTQFDIRGKYTATYSDTEGGPTVTQTMELTENTLSVTDVVGVKWNVPVALGEDYSLTLTAGESGYLGKTQFDEFLYVILSLSGSYILNTGSYSADLSMSDGKPVYTFRQEKTSYGTTNGFVLQGFNTKSPTYGDNNSNMGYWYLKCIDLKLVKQ